jgi:hypothetical protein
MKSNRPKTLFFILAFLVMSFVPGTGAAYELTPATGAVIFEQLSFRNAPDSGVGEITIDLSKARDAANLPSGFVNV